MSSTNDEGTKLTENCSICEEDLPPDSSPRLEHSCLANLAAKVKRAERTVLENDALMGSQSLLIAKVIADNEKAKGQLLELREEFESTVKELQEQILELKSKERTQVGSNRTTNVIEGVSSKHAELINKLKDQKLIKSDKVLHVMMSVDFRDFDSTGGSYLNEG